MARCNREILVLCDDGMLLWRRVEVEFDQAMKSGNWQGFESARADLEHHFKVCLANLPIVSAQAWTDSQSV
jgi:hypothetical protein